MGLYEDLAIIAFMKINDFQLNSASNNILISKLAQLLKRTNTSLRHRVYNRLSKVT